MNSSNNHRCRWNFFQRCNIFRRDCHKSLRFSKFLQLQNDYFSIWFFQRFPETEFPRVREEFWNKMRRSSLKVREKKTRGVRKELAIVRKKVWTNLETLATKSGGPPWYWFSQPSRRNFSDSSRQATPLTCSSPTSIPSLGSRSLNCFPTVSAKWSFFLEFVEIWISLNCDNYPELPVIHKIIHVRVWKYRRKKQI